MVSVEEMERLYNEKRQDALKVAFGDIGIEVRRGFVDTTRGLVLTSEAAMSVAASKANEANRKRKELSDREKKSIERSEKSRWITRAKLARKSVSEFKQGVRPLAVRRKVARDRTAARKIGAEPSHVTSDALLLLGLGLQ